MIFFDNADFALLFVRIITGIVMIYFGFPKIRNLKSNAEDFVEMGFRPGMLWGTIVAFLEFFGGIGIFLGVYVPIIAILFGFEMFMGFLWKILKAKKPFTDYSYDLILLAIMLVLATFGSGVYSLGY